MYKETEERGIRSRTYSVLCSVAEYNSVHNSMCVLNDSPNLRRIPWLPRQAYLFQHRDEEVSREVDRAVSSEFLGAVGGAIWDRW